MAPVTFAPAGVTPPSAEFRFQQKSIDIFLTSPQIYVVILIRLLLMGNHNICCGEEIRQNKLSGYLLYLDLYLLLQSHIVTDQIWY